MLSELQHASRAVETAKTLIHVTGHADSVGAWVPVGAGVHTGRAWFGAVGQGSHVELTVLGDAVNVAARLAAAAAAGEVLVTLAAAEAAKLDQRSLERRELALKGKAQSTSVVVVAGPARAPMPS